jgi:phosphohistidine phosphatase
MKTIIFGRHAKSSWKDFSLRDHDRPLNKRGYKDAKIIGQKLKEKGIIPDLLLTSSALRTLQTSELFLNYFNSTDIIVEEELYLAPVSTFIKIANKIDNKIETVMMIAHNPGITELANEFSNSYIPNIPTSGVFKVDFNISHWKDLNTFNGKVNFYIFPKMFKQ